MPRRYYKLIVTEPAHWSGVQRDLEDMLFIKKCGALHPIIYSNKIRRGWPPKSYCVGLCINTAGTLLFSMVPIRLEEVDLNEVH